MALAVRKNLELLDAAVERDADGISDKFDFADDLVGDNVAKHRTAAPRDAQRPARRAAAHPLCRKLLELRGIERDGARLEGVGLGEHQPRGRIGRQVVDREGASRQGGSRECGGGQRDAHQKLQPNPRLTRVASRFSRKPW